MAGNVRLQRGAHLAIQNKFRTVSLGFMPYLPETQRYRMELDASAQVLEQNKKGGDHLKVDIRSSDYTSERLV